MEDYIQWVQDYKEEAYDLSEIESRRKGCAPGCREDAALVFINSFLNLVVFIFGRGICGA